MAKLNLIKHGVAFAYGAADYGLREWDTKEVIDDQLMRKRNWGRLAAGIGGTVGLILSPDQAKYEPLNSALEGISLAATPGLEEAVFDIVRQLTATATKRSSDYPKYRRRTGTNPAEAPITVPEGNRYMDIIG